MSNNKLEIKKIRKQKNNQFLRTYEPTQFTPNNDTKVGIGVGIGVGIPRTSPKRGKPDKGYSMSEDPKGASPNGDAICTEIRRRNKRAHQQIRRVCQSIDRALERRELLGLRSTKTTSKQTIKENNKREAQEAQEAQEAEKANALIALILGKAKAPKNSELAREVETLKNLLTIFKTNSLRGLTQLAQGKTAKVLVDTKKEVAYKLIEVNEGEVGGTFPKEIRIRPEDNQILISGCKKHSLLKMIKAIEISNDHGGPLFTELAGFTESGDLIICQPYIKNLRSIEMFDSKDANQSTDLNNSIETLGMHPLGEIGSPFAVGISNGKYTIFDDLHGDNVLKDKKGDVFLVDSLATRYLTPKEIEMLKDKLPKQYSNKTQSKEDELEIS